MPPCSKFWDNPPPFLFLTFSTLPALQFFSIGRPSGSLVIHNFIILIKNFWMLPKSHLNRNRTIEISSLELRPAFLPACFYICLSTSPVVSAGSVTAACWMLSSSPMPNESISFSPWPCLSAWAALVEAWKYCKQINNIANYTGPTVQLCFRLIPPVQAGPHPQHVFFSIAENIFQYSSGLKQQTFSVRVKQLHNSTYNNFIWFTAASVLTSTTQLHFTANLRLINFIKKV